jgi:hypothetical protein
MGKNVKEQLPAPQQQYITLFLKLFWKESHVRVKHNIFTE